MNGLPREQLEELSVAPFPLRTLMAMLKDYAQPLFKVHSLTTDGTLIRLKRGWFCVNPKLFKRPVSSAVAANMLYEGGPSYISLEYALSFYGLVPERAQGVTSVVTGRSKVFSTPIGWFSYRTLPAPLFGFGVNAQDGYLMASPEKALCDYLFTRTNLRITSPSALRDYLENDVRFDFDAFENYDASVFHEYAAAGFKKNLFLAVERLFA